jgi:hypothetical protein
MHGLAKLTVVLSLLLLSVPARAQDVTPAEAKALVTAPKGPADGPGIDEKPPEDHTTASVSAGAQAATGNTRLVAGTANGLFEMRRGQNGFGFSLIGNYGEALEAPAPTITTTNVGMKNQTTMFTFPNGTNPYMQETAENIQGRIRYDRFVNKTTSFFLILTGRHDKFQGLHFRFNVDPGIKQVLYGGKALSLWAELGYDFQYDNRYADALDPTSPATGLPILPGPLPPTATDHSVRTYIGFRDAFNKEVTLTTGIEYLQSLVTAENARVNVDALLAAKIFGGLAVGVGFGLRFDNNPLPTKLDTDTSTTLNLIYSYADLPAKKPPTGPDGCKCAGEPSPAAPPDMKTVVPPPPPPPAPVSPAAPTDVPPPPPPPPPPPLPAALPITN